MAERAKFFYYKSKLLFKKTWAEKVYELRYEAPADFEYKPGQYMGIQINSVYRRAYSILDHKDNYISFLIDTKPGKTASLYWDEVEVGAENLILGPYGKFAYQDNDNRKVLISTGTGIVPFVPMVFEIIKNKPEVQIDFFFGTRYLQNDIAYPIFKDIISERFKYVRCITRPEESTSNPYDYPYESSRITGVITKYNYDMAHTEFYICGGPEMVEDLVGVLKGMGATMIYTEKYG